MRYLLIVLLITFSAGCSGIGISEFTLVPVTEDGVVDWARLARMAREAAPEVRASIEAVIAQYEGVENAIEAYEERNADPPSRLEQERDRLLDEAANYISQFRLIDIINLIPARGKPF